ncbi:MULTISPECIES: ribosomal protein S18-alanine N-acetyltransferase [Caloramator]|uniref:ribosomal protein S18-alanine N-acetyltransferase n=1 Tax=Caloramator TaxID=44258 RepID=UPI000687EE52|nr:MULTISPECIES: ribosomal protein S18-alanine N-acetyltransferase [Caloramator]
MKRGQVRRLSEYIIEDMKLEDIDGVYEVEVLSFKTPWSKEAFQTELTRNSCAVYKVLKYKGKVIGYAGMWCMIDEGHITNIAVHPEFRGAGFGEKLVDVLIDEAKRRNINAMTLEVRVSNLPAINLYKKKGFTCVATRKGYYQDTGEDAYIMWKYDLDKN